MWARAVAIRPVPKHALVASIFVERALAELSEFDESEEGESEYHKLYERFEAHQSALARLVTENLRDGLDETALGLGFQFFVTIYRSFELAFGDSVQPVRQEDVEAMDKALVTEEELRRDDGHEPIDWEQVLELEQPALFEFVNGRIDESLDVGDVEDVDVDDVHRIFRATALFILTLSHRVQPPTSGGTAADTELQA